MIDHKELRRLAGDATDPDWDGHLMEDGVEGVIPENVYGFQVAATPTTIIALLDELEKLTTDNDQLSHDCEYMRACLDKDVQAHTEAMLKSDLAEAYRHIVDYHRRCQNFREDDHLLNKARAFLRGENK